MYWNFTWRISTSSTRSSARMLFSTIRPAESLVFCRCTVFPNLPVPLISCEMTLQMTPSILSTLPTLVSVASLTPMVLTSLSKQFKLRFFGFFSGLKRRFRPFQKLLFDVLQKGRDFPLADFSVPETLGRVGEKQFVFGARHAHVKKAPLFLRFLSVTLPSKAERDKPVFAAGDKNHGKFQPLGRVQSQKGDAVSPFIPVVRALFHLPARIPAKRKPGTFH